MDWDDLAELALRGSLERTGALLRAHAWLESALKERFGEDEYRKTLLSELLSRAGIHANDHRVMRARGLRQRVTHQGLIPSLEFVLNDLVALRETVAIIEGDEEDEIHVTGLTKDDLRRGGELELTLTESVRERLLRGACSPEPLVACAALALTVGLLHASVDKALAHVGEPPSDRERLPSKLGKLRVAGWQVDPDEHVLSRAIEIRNKTVHFGVDPRVRSSLDPPGRFALDPDPSADRLVGAAYAAAEHALTIAAISELVHNAIIVHDDIADGDRRRRGGPSAWAEYGVCHAIHSAMFVLSRSYGLARGLPKAVPPLDEHLGNCYEEVCRAQIAQALMRLDGSEGAADFRAVHVGKTAIGRWALTSPAILAGRGELVASFDRYARKLGEAGTLKNDLEDLLPEIGEGQRADVRAGLVTMPLRETFRACADAERRMFLDCFGSGESDTAWIARIARSHGVAASTIVEIRSLVESAKEAVSWFGESSITRSLVRWAEFHVPSASGQVNE